MLPAVLAILQLLVIFEGPPWAVIANAVSLIMSVIAIPSVKPAWRFLAENWKRRGVWRTGLFWRSVVLTHVVVVPPWFFLGIPGDFTFPGLYALGIAAGAIAIWERVSLRAHSRTEKV